MKFFKFAVTFLLTFFASAFVSLLVAILIFVATHNISAALSVGIFGTIALTALLGMYD